MARTASIDKRLALRLMLKGLSDSQIAARFGTSRQAVNLQRKAFVKQGHPVDIVRHVKQLTTDEPTVTTPTQKTHGNLASEQTAPTFDQVGEWITRMVTEAAEAKRLRNENEALRASNAALKAEITDLTDRLSKSTDLETRSREFSKAIHSLTNSEDAEQP